MRPLDHNYRRSESEVILKALSEQILVGHVVDGSIAAETEYWSGAVQSRFYEPDEALAHYEEAIVLYRAVGSRLGEANTLKGIGDVLQFKDRNDEALAHYEEAIGLYRAVGFRLGEANTLKAIGDVLKFKDRNDEALAHYEEAIVLYRAVGERLGEANTLKAIGSLEESMEKKLQLVQDAHQIYITIGDRYSEANCNMNLQNIYQQRGQFNLARHHRHQAYRIWQDLQLPLAVLPLPDFTKKMLTSMDDGEWVDTVIQSDNQMAWLFDSIGYLLFVIRLILSPLTKLQKQFKIPAKYFWFCIGITIAFLVWKLKN